MEHIRAVRQSPEFLKGPTGRLVVKQQVTKQKILVKPYIPTNMRQSNEVN